MQPDATTADTTAATISALIPYVAKLVLSIASVALIERVKIYDRFPYLAKQTDKANQLASALVALIVSACFHWQELVGGWGTGADLVWIGKDFGVQMLMQEGIYRVGWKNALSGLLQMIGQVLGIVPPKSPLEEVSVKSVPEVKAEVKALANAVNQDAPK